MLDWLTLRTWPLAVSPIEVTAPIRWAAYDARGITLRVDEVARGRLRLSRAGEAVWVGHERLYVPNRSISIRDAEVLHRPLDTATDAVLRLDLLSA